MAKVAKLVLLSVMTRVIVDEDADNTAIFNATKDKLKDYRWDIGDIESIKDDIELPYGELDNETRKVYNVTFYNMLNKVIDSTQIDEENHELAWELFKEFGHTKKDGDYLEFEEVDED